MYSRPRLLLSSADDNDVHGNNFVVIREIHALILHDAFACIHTILIDRASYGGKENGIFPEQNDENRKQAHGVTTESDIYKRAIMNQHNTMRDATTCTVIRNDSGPKYQVNFAYIQGEKKYRVKEKGTR